LTGTPRLSRSRPGPPGALAALTDGQRAQLAQWQRLLEAPCRWSGSLPVAVLERCWLRLRCVPVERLARVLPPDGSEAAPELVRFRELRQGGLDDWSAQLQCWQEFGSAAVQQAQRRLWHSHELGHHGWTLGRYLALLERYRSAMAPGGRRELPLLVLAREGSREEHQLFWLPGQGAPIRHTCA
jgi:hypothetical protein